MKHLFIALVLLVAHPALADLFGPCTCRERATTRGPQCALISNMDKAGKSPLMVAPYTTELACRSACALRRQGRAPNGAPIYSFNSCSVMTSALLPDAPLNLVAVTRPGGFIEIGWTDRCHNETGYKIERSADGRIFTQIAFVAANTTKFVTAGHTIGRRYYFRVRVARGAVHSRYSNTASAIALAQLPTLSATSLSPTSVRLTFTRAVRIRRYLTAGAADPIEAIFTPAARQTELTDEGLFPGTIYVYRVEGLGGYLSAPVATSTPELPEEDPSLLVCAPPEETPVPVPSPEPPPSPAPSTEICWDLDDALGGIGKLDPSGPWLFGYRRSGGAFTPMTQTFTGGITMTGAWGGYAGNLSGGIGDGSPAVYDLFGEGPATPFNFALNILHEPGHIMAHPGPLMGDEVVVRFLVPTDVPAGNLTAVGSFVGCDTSQQGAVAAWVTIGESQVFPAGAPAIISNRARVDYQLGAIPVASGDPVDFVVNPYGAFYSDSTCLAAHVCLSAPQQ